MIKVLFLSSSDNMGGAAKATLKLFKALQKTNISVRMLVKKKLTNDATISRIFTLLPMTVHLALDNYILNRYKGPRRHFWSLGFLPNLGLWLRLRLLRYDIVQLNWVNAGFMPVKLLRAIRKPIIWRLSDNWAFTGGCHIPENCEKYTSGCGACPQLGSSDESDISRTVINRKLRYWNKLNMTIVAPSRWMAASAQSSLLFRERNVVYIPTGVNTEIFKPLNKRETRAKLGLGEDKGIILFGAVDALTDPRKGFHFLLTALKRLAEIHPDPSSVELAVFGHADKIPNVDLKFKVTFAGYISDTAKLNEFYSSADVYVLPSVMENSPNTVLEALSAGTPAVAFNACGTAEYIEHKIDGFLAEPLSTDDLANGLLYCLERRQEMHLQEAARRKMIEMYNIDRVANQYRELYESIAKTAGLSRHGH